MNQLVDIDGEQAIDSSKIATRTEIKYIKRKFSDVDLPFTEVEPFIIFNTWIFAWKITHIYYMAIGY